MSRALAPTLSFALLWSGAGYGLSDICCCTMGTYTAMEQMGYNCRSYHDHSSGLKRASDHDADCQCLGLRCEGQLGAFRLTAVESVAPGNQVATGPMGLLDVERALQAGPSMSVRIHSFPLHSLDLLLRTCSFLS